MLYIEQKKQFSFRGENKCSKLLLSMQKQFSAFSADCSHSSVSNRFFLKTNSVLFSAFGFPEAFFFFLTSKSSSFVQLYAINYEQYKNVL